MLRMVYFSSSELESTLVVVNLYIFHMLAYYGYSYHILKLDGLDHVTLSRMGG